MYPLSILLLIWPYVFFGVVSIGEELDLSAWVLVLYFIIAIMINIANLGYSSSRESNSYRKLALSGMIVKLFHIPYYLLTFVIGLGLLASAVVPGLIFFTPVLVFVLAVINYTMMITSSSYGINSLIRLRKNEKISNTFLVVNTIMHLMFVLDCISSIIVYVKCRKVDKEQN